jgi:hypothetical protein
VSPYSGWIIISVIINQLVSSVTFAIREVPWAGLIWYLYQILISNSPKLNAFEHTSMWAWLLEQGLKRMIIMEINQLPVANHFAKQDGCSSHKTLVTTFHSTHLINDTCYITPYYFHMRCSNSCLLTWTVFSWQSLSPHGTKLFAEKGMAINIIRVQYIKVKLWN